MENLFVVLHWNWFYFSFNLPRMLSALLRSVHSFFLSCIFCTCVVCALSFFLSLTPLFICFESVQQTRTQRNCINYERWHRNVRVFNVTIFILLYMISHLVIYRWWCCRHFVQQSRNIQFGIRKLRTRWKWFKYFMKFYSWW